MFDIDKLFLSRLNYRRVEVESVASDYIWDADPLTGTAEPIKRIRTKHKLTTEFKEGSNQYWQNKLINGYLTILKSSKNMMSQLHGAIDSDTKLLEDVRDDLRLGKRKFVLLPYSSSMLSTHVREKMNFSGGKDGIGPYALNNNNHILTMLYGVKFDWQADKDNSILNWLSGDGFNMNDLSKAEDRYGQSILSWLSGLINAHVDVAKDPYIPELGVNSFTYNTVSLLIRTGLGKDTFYFTTQPIIKQMANAYMNASGVYMQDSNVSKYTRLTREVNKFFVNYVNRYYNQSFLTDNKNLSASKDSAIALIEERMKSDHGVEAKWLIKYLFSKEGSDKILRPIAKGQRGNFVFKTKYNTYELTYDEVQLLVAYSKFKFDPYEQALSSLVQYSKIDTKKLGNNIQELSAYGAAYSKLFNAKKSLFDLTSLNRFRRGSFIEIKTQNALQMYSKILELQLIQGSAMFNFLLDTLSKLIGSDRDDARFKNELTKALLNKIKSNYFNEYCTRLGINQKALVNGDDTIYDRLNAIKLAIATDPKYSSYRAKDGSCLNYLIETLTSDERYENKVQTSTPIGMAQDDYGNVKFIKNQNSFEEDSVKSDELTQAWEDLLGDNEHPELQQFARDLVVYAFITSGDNGGRYDLFKYVPNSWKLGLFDNGRSYRDYMQQTLQDYKFGLCHISQDDYDDIVLNYWWNDMLVPIQSDKTKFTTFCGSSNIPILIAGIGTNGSAFDDTTIPMYFKMKRQGVTQGLRQYNVYKRIGTGSRIVDGKPTNYPIYMLVQQRGCKYLNGQTIYSLGRTDSVENEFDKAYSFAVGETWKQQLASFGYNITNGEELLLAMADAISTGKYDVDSLISWANTPNTLKYKPLITFAKEFVSESDLMSYDTMTNTVEQKVRSTQEDTNEETEQQQSATVYLNDYHNGQRAYIRQSDKQYITERVLFKDGKKTHNFGGEDITAEELLKYIDFLNSLINDPLAEDETSMLYSYFKQLPKDFIKSVQSAWESWMGNGYDRYNESTKSVSMMRMEYLLFSQMIKDSKFAKFINTKDYDDLFDIEGKKYFIEELQLDLYYTYDDSRQLKFDFEDSYDNYTKDNSVKVNKFGIPVNNLELPYSNSRGSKWLFIVNAVLHALDYYREHIGGPNMVSDMKKYENKDYIAIKLNHNEFVYDRLKSHIENEIRDRGGNPNDFNFKHGNNVMIISSTDRFVLGEQMDVINRLQQLGEQVKKQCE